MNDWAVILYHNCGINLFHGKCCKLFKASWINPETMPVKCVTSQPFWVGPRVLLGALCLFARLLAVLCTDLASTPLPPPTVSSGTCTCFKHLLGTKYSCNCVYGTVSAGCCSQGCMAPSSPCQNFCLRSTNLLWHVLKLIYRWRELDNKRFVL